MTKKTNIPRSPVPQNEEPVHSVGADPFVCYIVPGLPPKNTPRIQFSVLKSHLRDEVVSKIPKQKTELENVSRKKNTTRAILFCSLQKKNKQPGFYVGQKKNPSLDTFQIHEAVDVVSWWIQKAPGKRLGREAAGKSRPGDR